MRLRRETKIETANPTTIDASLLSRENLGWLVARVLSPGEENPGQSYVVDGIVTRPGFLLLVDRQLDSVGANARGAREDNLIEPQRGVARRLPSAMLDFLDNRSRKLLTAELRRHSADVELLDLQSVTFGANVRIAGTRRESRVARR